MSAKHPGSSFGADRPTVPAPESNPASPSTSSGAIRSAQSFSAAGMSGAMAETLTPGSGREPSFDSFNMASPVADPLLGVVVAERYRIVELLGRGGMGIVYRVEHTRIGKLLAMKLLTGELSRNAEVVRRFKHEALTASKLNSPNTVQVFDFGASEGLTYLVMELVAGDDLGRVLRATGPIQGGRLARIIIQVCSSLAEAHQKGIVHRDVKPENIMLLKGRDGSDVAKVLDFGLAKLREGSELNAVTSQGAIVGTPYFMSPEQVRGEAVDQRSDVYAVGALMYRASTGHYPFNGPTPMAVFTKHLTELPPPPHERAPERNISKGLSDIVMVALQKEPAHRFQRIEDLQTALIDESKTLSSSSVDVLLDSDRMRKLSDEAKGDGAPSAVAGRSGLAMPAIATRDEVEAYERKLRRKMWGLMAFLVVVPVGAAGAGANYYFQRPVAFGGEEIEPNNTAKEATEVPMGHGARGYLGKRIDLTTSDRDFYAFEVPANPSDDGAGGTVRLRVTSLPNFRMCTFLYQGQQSAAMAQYCVGRESRDLDIPALRLAPGRYLAAVSQDLDPYGEVRAPPVHENVSDAYEFRVEPSSGVEGMEVEPNDQLTVSHMMGAGDSIEATLGWVTDEDYYCLKREPGGGTLGFAVEDDGRDPGSVLRVTPVKGGSEGAAVRIHTSGGGEENETDVMNPWTGPDVLPGAVEDSVCLKVSLGTDPWAAEQDSKLVPRGGTQTYRIRVETR